MSVLDFLFGKKPAATPSLAQTHSSPEASATIQAPRHISPLAGEPDSLKPIEAVDLRGSTKPGESEMPDLITPENVSVEYLKSLFDAAYLEYTTTDKGELRVKERISVLVRLNKEQRTIKLYSIFGFKPTSSMAQRLECANKINAEYIIIRCSVAGEGIWFEHEFLLDGGLTPKALIQGIKRFAAIPISAINEHGGDLVE